MPTHASIWSEVEKTKIKRICKTCGKEFKVFSSQIKSGRGKYCSHKCQGVASSKELRGENSPNWEGGKVNRLCKTCGKEFEVKLSRILKGEGKYCSNDCMGVAYSKERKGKNTPNWKGGPLVVGCQECGKEFKVGCSVIKKGNGKYCSKKCSGKAQSKRQTGKNSPVWKGGKIERICGECGNSFYVFPSQFKRTGAKYCSLSCSTKANNKKLRHKKSPTKTKPELIFEEICKRNSLPFRFVGNRLFWIGCNPSLNPDFIHANKTKKICVEVFGAWWHNSMLNQKIPYERTYNGRKALLKRNGWKMIGIWDHDILRKDAEAFVLYTLKKHNIHPSTT